MTKKPVFKELNGHKDFCASIINEAKSAIFWNRAKVRMAGASKMPPSVAKWVLIMARDYGVLSDEEYRTVINGK